jgi:hypothetical protein
MVDYVSKWVEACHVVKLPLRSPLQWSRAWFSLASVLRESW